jgi:outer membrane protein
LYPFVNHIVTQKVHMWKGLSKKNMGRSIFSYTLLKLIVMAACCFVPASCGFMEKQMDKTVGGPNPPADTTITMAGDEEEEGPIAPPRKVTQPSGPLKITTTEAVLLSLTNNRSLVVEKLNPAITKTFEDTERAVFDPKAAAKISGGRTNGERQARAGAATEDSSRMKVWASFPWNNSFPRAPPSALEATTEMENSSLYQDAFYWSRLGLTVNQAILRGYGSDVNLVRLRQARLETRMSEFELRGFTLALVAQVEETFWDYALAKRQVEIFEESLKVARQQVNETLALIEVGRLAKSELPAVQAEMAAQEQGLINARSNAGNHAVAAPAPPQSERDPICGSGKWI